jgi:hypothetical protein
VIDVNPVSAPRDADAVRAALDAAMREWVSRGEAANVAFSEACNAKPRDQRKVDEAWALLGPSHESDCASHNESLNCCLDREHKKYGAMLDFLVAKLVGSP